MFVWVVWGEKLSSFLVNRTGEQSYLKYEDLRVLLKNVDEHIMSLLCNLCVLCFNVYLHQDEQCLCRKKQVHKIALKSDSDPCSVFTTRFLFCIFYNAVLILHVWQKWKIVTVGGLYLYILWEPIYLPWILIIVSGIVLYQSLIQLMPAYLFHTLNRLHWTSWSE